MKINRDTGVYRNGRAAKLADRTKRSSIREQERDIMQKQKFQEYMKIGTTVTYKGIAATNNGTSNFI
ncbi:MAG: hypothetical protein ACLTS6_06950 [Anaerobutyricum sp.]